MFHLKQLESLFQVLRGLDVSVPPPPHRSGKEQDPQRRVCSAPAFAEFGTGAGHVSVHLFTVQFTMHTLWPVTLIKTLRWTAIPLQRSL